MSAAYVDSSCLVAVALEETLAAEVMASLEAHEELVSSNLLEAELLAALVREGVNEIPQFLDGVSWVLPHRPLTHEIRTTLRHGYVRGADLWHLATALYVAETPASLPFLTLDRRQREMAATLGFPTR